MIRQIHHLGRACRQRAGLVEHDRIDLRQTFQRRGILDQHPAPEQLARRGGGDGRHRQPQRTGAGDDQHCRRDIEGGAHVPGIDIPARKAERGQNMHPRRIEFRGTVGQRRIARPAAFGDSDQVGHAVQRGIAPHGRGPHCQRAGQVHLSRTDGQTGFGKDRHRLAGQKRSVDLGPALGDDPVHRHPAAGAHQHQITRAQFGDRQLHLNLAPQHHGARHFKRGELLRG